MEGSGKESAGMEDGKVKVKACAGSSGTCSAEKEEERDGMGGIAGIEGIDGIEGMEGIAGMEGMDIEGIDIEGIEGRESERLIMLRRSEAARSRCAAYEYGDCASSSCARDTGRCRLRCRREGSR